MKTIRLFLAGEGKSDIGFVDAQSGEFVPREMTLVADAVIRRAASTDELAIQYEFMSEQSLTELRKKVTHREATTCLDRPSGVKAQNVFSFVRRVGEE